MGRRPPTAAQRQACGSRDGALEAEAWALHELGWLDLILGNFDAAASGLKEALEKRSHLADDVGAAATRHNLGV